MLQMKMAKIIMLRVCNKGLIKFTKPTHHFYSSISNRYNATCAMKTRHRQMKSRDASKVTMMLQRCWWRCGYDGDAAAISGDTAATKFWWCCSWWCFSSRRWRRDDVRTSVTHVTQVSPQWLCGSKIEGFCPFEHALLARCAPLLTF